MKPRPIDKNAEAVLRDMRGRFAIVKKSRVRLWVTVGTLFFIAGFIVAFFLVVH